MLPELQPHADKLLHNRARLDGILAALSDSEWNAPRGAEHYTARETVAHLSGGGKSMLLMAQNWVKGETTTLRPDFDLDRFNARQQEKRLSASNADLVSEWHGAQDAVIAYMETIGTNELDKRGQHPVEGDITVRQIFGVIAEHEAQHIRQLAGAEG